MAGATARKMKGKSKQLQQARSRRGRQFWPVRGWLAAVTAGMALLASAPGIRGEAPEPASSEPQEILVEALSETGEVITDRVASGLAVDVDERELETTDLGPVGNQWRLVVYFDLLLASTQDFHNASVQLAERARELTRLGSVELIVAGEEVTTALPANSDAEALSQALGWLRMREFSENSQVEVRRAFLEQLGLEQEAAEEAPSEAAVELDPDSVRELARAAEAEEIELLRRHREQLMLWAVENASSGPQALFLVGSGFDAEPNEFYRQALADSPWSGVSRDLLPQPIEPSVGELGQVLSVYGWTVLSYLPEQRGDALLEESEEEARARQEEEMVDVVYQDGRVVDRTTIGFDALEALKRRKRDAEAQARPLLLSPEQPFGDLAQSTGGELLRGVFQLSDVLVRLSLRHRLVLAAGQSEIAAPRRLEVRLRGERQAALPRGASVRAREWISETTPEVVATVRARRVLLDELEEGELTLSAAVQPAEAQGAPRLIVQRDTYEQDPAELVGPLRLTVAVADEEGSGEIYHRQLDGWRIPPDGDPILELPIDSMPEGVLVVLVEELQSRRWGATFATFVEAAGMRTTAAGYDALFLPAPKVIHLLAPPQGFAMGPTVFETVVSEPQVAQVDFYLDGEREAVRRTPPFTADLDLGSLPQPRRVEVIARDEDGLEMGRDYLIVNEGSGVFGVRILKPRLDPVDGKPPRLVGPVDVEAEVEPRRGEGIDRVEFFWKETLVATRYARPYRQRVVIPADDPTGFLRVVAYLEDGASSEDVVFVNSTGPSERLMVNLMELYVVVTDRKGKPVKGLPREVFRISEEDQPQEIATFSDAGDLPLTVGMVIDSSASMFVKLPDVQLAAGDFLRGLETRRDRAFVVGFGDDPRMTRSTTSDLPAVINSLGALRPDGQTAIWKAMTYSLVQLQGVPGKKALVVYTDGADEDPDFSYRTLLKFARKVGVPIYVILSNNEIRRTEGRGLNVKDFLDRLETLTNSVGGRVYLARVGEDLEDVYAEIAEELRSQYVVGYYSVDTGGKEWRNVEVDVDKPGYKARTIAGYYR